MPTVVIDQELKGNTDYEKREIDKHVMPFPVGDTELDDDVYQKEDAYP